MASVAAKIAIAGSTAPTLITTSNVKMCLVRAQRVVAVEVAPPTRTRCPPPRHPTSAASRRCDSLEPGDPEHRQDQPGGDRQTHEDVTALQGSHLEDVVDDDADESGHRDRDGDAREAWPGVESMVRTHPQLVTLAEPVQPGLEWRESGSDDDPLGEGWQHELAAAIVDDPDLPRCAVVHQVAHTAIRLDVERVVVALTGHHRALFRVSLARSAIRDQPAEFHVMRSRVPARVMQIFSGGRPDAATPCRRLLGSEHVHLRKPGQVRHVDDSAPTSSEIHDPALLEIAKDPVDGGRVVAVHIAGSS